LATLSGGYKFAPTWMIDHIDFVNFAPEEQVFNGFILMTQYTFYTSVLIAFYKIIFGKDYSSTKIPLKDFVLSCIFIYLFLLLSIGVSG
jgi:hypothetical protein